MIALFIEYPLCDVHSAAHDIFTYSLIEFYQNLGLRLTSILQIRPTLIINVTYPGHTQLILEASDF